MEQCSRPVQDRRQTSDEIGSQTGQAVSKRADEQAIETALATAPRSPVSGGHSGTMMNDRVWIAHVGARYMPSLTRPLQDRSTVHYALDAVVATHVGQFRRTI